MKIFINYRRDDSAGYAGRLFDVLTAHFGAQSVFMDINRIQPGQDFRKVVQHEVGTCDVVLVMMGKQWLNIADEQGLRRLDDPRDWVRVEIASALANPRVRVIPVLVREASMPGPDELPDELKELAWRNAIELSDQRFQYDTNQLIGVIKQASEGRKLKMSGPILWLGILGFAMLGLFLMIRFDIIPLSIFKRATPTSIPASTPTVAMLELLTPASPTSEILDTPISAFPLSIRKLEARDLTSISSIWAENGIVLEDMKSPGKKPYPGVVRVGQEYRFSIYWCATNARTLNENMNNMKISFYVNGEPVPEDYILTYDQDLERMKCRTQVVALSGWIANDSYKLEARRNILAKISDGKTNYPAGVYSRELTVTAE